MSDLPIHLSQATLVADKHGVCAIGKSDADMAIQTHPIIGLNYAAGLILDSEKKSYVATWNPENLAVYDNYVSPHARTSNTLSGFQIELFEFACPVSLVAAKFGVIITDWAPFALNGAVYIVGLLGKGPIETLAIHRISYIDRRLTTAITYPEGHQIFLSEPFDQAHDLLVRQGLLQLAVPPPALVHVLSAQDLRIVIGKKEVWSGFLPASNAKHRAKIVPTTKHRSFNSDR